ncbi:MAG: protein kinase [Planctomycetaceae bacterium]|nr:protein kinase [Planctomycetaceae bacterium]
MSTEKFLELLDKSGLVSKDQVDEVLASLESSATSQEMGDGEFVGKILVERGLITPWHLRQLLKKRYKGFFIRQYKILGLLGAGGMSTVYLAEHTLMQRRVAIKVLPKERLKKAAYLDHFVREAQVIATLDHPNIIRAYDIDREDDIHYIVMEFFEGVNLQKKVETEGPLAVPDIVLYIRQAAEALAYAHKVGIVHRDVKPGNLLVNAKNQVKLLDLGLAMIDQRLYSGNLSSSLQEASILGTADYLAPEQAINSQNIDSRADIYALGGVLYFCLTGHSPFPTGSVSERLLAHQQKEPPSILKDRPNTAKDLIAICRKMMDKDPNKRHQTAGEVVRDLDRWLVAHGHLKIPPSLAERPAKMADPGKRPEERPKEKPAEKLPPLTLPPLPPTGTGVLPKLVLPSIPKKEGQSILPLLPPIPPPLSKKQAMEEERNEYLTPVASPKSFGKFDEDSVTSTGAGPLIFGENQDGIIDLTDVDFDLTTNTLGMKTDVDLTVHEEPKIDDSFLTPDSSVDFGGKTDPDIESILKREETPAIKEEPKVEEALTFKEEPKVEEALTFKEEPKVEEALTIKEEPKVEEALTIKEEPKVEEALTIKEEPKVEEALTIKEEPGIEEVPAKKAEPKVEEVPAKKAAPKEEPKKESPKIASQSAQPQPAQPQPAPVAQPQKKAPEKPKSLIQVDQRQPLDASTGIMRAPISSAVPTDTPPTGIMRAPVPSKAGVVQRILPSATTTSAPDSTSSTGTHSLIAQDQVVIKPPTQGRILDPQPVSRQTLQTPSVDIFPLASDSKEMDIFPIAGEVQKPRSAAPPSPQPTDKVPSKKKPLTDDDYDKMITNFVSSQMPVSKGNENDTAVIQAVAEMKKTEDAKKRAEEAKKRAEERAALEKARLEQEAQKQAVQKTGTISGLSLKPALKKEMETEEPRGPIAAPRIKKQSWFEMVPVWFWTVFGSFIACTFILGLILLFLLTRIS